MGADGAIFSLQNKCNTTIWPGIQAARGYPQLMNGGFELNSGETINIHAPTGWFGRLWGRNGCSFDHSGRGKCVTGDCNGGARECAGAGGEPPATVAEFILDNPLDFYAISLVDGFNIPISIVPSGGLLGECKSVKCLSNLNQRCPKELQIRRNDYVVACKSACLAFNRPQYCCTGTYNNPTDCKLTNYTRVFKDSCPAAYSYAYDDLSSIFTCYGANYVITFC
ncbi:hypothetical protein U1Q18_023289 [Sarracenia purpurea var. burkii]